MSGKVIVDLGCGREKHVGAIGLDNRRTPDTDLLCNATSIALRDNSVDELYAFGLLEHFTSPKDVLLEAHRILKPNGKAIFRVPNIGTYSAHLDPTHVYNADLGIWKMLIGGFFYKVQVRPFGPKYRDNRLLVFINKVLIHGFKFYELSQGFEFTCSGLKPNPTPGYVGWWEEESL